MVGILRYQHIPSGVSHPSIEFNRMSAKRIGSEKSLLQIISFALSFKNRLSLKECGG